MQLRRSYLEVSHQLENAHEEVRGLSLRLQENVSYSILSLSLSALGCFVTKKRKKKTRKTSRASSTIIVNNFCLSFYFVYIVWLWCLFKKTQTK